MARATRCGKGGIAVIDEKYVYSISNLNKIMLLFHDHKYKYFDLNSVFGFMVFQTANN